MTIEFNPAKKTDDKGVGKIHLGEEAAPAQKPAEAASPEKKKKMIIIGAGGLAAVVALAGIFSLASGGAKKAANSNPPAPPAVTQTYQQPTAPPPVTTYQQPTAPAQVTSPAPTDNRGAIVAQGIQAKEGVIYRDDSQAYKDQTGARGEMYIGANGQEVGAGQDFAVHVSLFNKGGVSVLVAQGPYAGSRVDIFPVGSQRITYTKVGQEVGGQFQALPSYQRTSSTEAMKYPRTQGNGVSVNSYNGGLQKKMLSNGSYVTAFTVTGAPQDDGAFSVKIWNGDTYSVNLKTGDYSISSAFLSDPDYAATYKRTGVSVSRTKVNGVMQMAPSVAPRAANTWRP